MHRALSLSGCLLPAMLCCLLLPAQEKLTYPTPPEAVRQDGVPRGQLIQGVYRDSRIFPGTERDYWLYRRVQSRHSRRNPGKSRGLPCETVLSSFGKESELVKKRRFP
jgi:hypothetical protein